MGEKLDPSVIFGEDAITPSQQPTKWDSLSEIGFDQNNALASKEKVLRNRLINAGKDFARQESFNYSAIGNEISKTGYKELGKISGDQGVYISRLDNKRTDTLVDYLDAKFSDNPSISDRQETIWHEYEAITNQRAGATSNITNSLSHQLRIQGDPSFTDTIQQLSTTEELPAAQVALASLYRQYFDDPSEKNKKILTESVQKYSQSLKQVFGKIAFSLPNTRANQPVQELLGMKLGNNLANGYGSIHSAIMDYYAFKSSNNHHDTPNQPKASSPTTIKSTPPKDPANSLPLDIL